MSQGWRLKQSNQELSLASHLMRSNKSATSALVETNGECATHKFISVPSYSQRKLPKKNPGPYRSLCSILFPKGNSCQWHCGVNPDQNKRKVKSLTTIRYATYQQGRGSSRPVNKGVWPECFVFLFCYCTPAQSLYLLRVILSTKLHDQTSVATTCWSSSSSGLNPSC